jgi:hypothetical protein
MMDAGRHCIGGPRGSLIDTPDGRTERRDIMFAGSTCNSQQIGASRAPAGAHRPVAVTGGCDTDQVRTIPPADWKIVPALLRSLWLLALAVAMLSLLTDPPWPTGPIWFGVTTFLGAPILFGMAGLAISRRFPRLKTTARLVAGISAVALVGNVGLLLLTKHYIHELRKVVPRNCRPHLANCTTLVASKFGSPGPRHPSIESVDGYTFRDGEESGKILAFVYYRQSGLDDNLVFSVSARTPDEREPPSDPAAFMTMPGGQRVVEQAGQLHGVRFDFWDARFHYAVSAYDRGKAPGESRAAAMTFIEGSR